ncbi:MAG: DUF308 domain-containing protein [Promethearchaeota archaeon]
MLEKFSENHVRLLNIIIGILVCVLSIVIIIFSTAAILVLLFIIANILLIIGIARMYNALTNEKTPKSEIIFKLISASFAIFISLLAEIFMILNPTESILISVIIFGIALLIIGIARIGVGLINKELNNGYRGLIIIVGIITLILSIISIAIPTLGEQILIIIIAVPLLLNGVAKIVLGIISSK